MTASATVTGGQNIARRLRELEQKLQTKGVAVGLPADAGTHPEAGMSFAKLGAIHEFGATIDHPGGTPYMVTRDGVRFMPKSYADSGLRVTKPHKIKIPERSFLRVPLRAAQDQIAADFKRLLKMVVRDKLTMTQALDQIGAKGAAISQQAISSGIAPPNTAATERRKGSTTPLMDKGHLRQAITWVLEDNES